MIQNLLVHIIAVLRQTFAGTMPDPANHIGAGPVADPAAAALPFVAVSAGKLEIEPFAKDMASSEARPQEFVEERAIDAVHPQGPYTLAKTPLKTSTRCKLVLQKGTTDERQVLLTEGSDFQIDYQNAIVTFIRNVAPASSILFRYSFPGVFTVQDFSQEFHIIVYAADYGAVEQWAALSTSVILTSRDELLDFYNQGSRTVYTAGPFVSTHTLSQVMAVGGAPSPATTGLKLDCAFRVLGQMKLTREVSEGFALIQKVRSPGRTGGPIDIDAALE